MSAPEERPLSVAELLARNGTIGAPPIGGRRRRKRRNSDGVSVAELTGEIPVVRTGEIPVVGDDEYVDEDGDDVEYAEGEYAEGEYDGEYDGEYAEDEYDGEYADGEHADEAVAAAEYAGEEYTYSAGEEVAAEYPAAALEPESSEMVIVYTAAEEQTPVIHEFTEPVVHPEVVEESDVVGFSEVVVESDVVGYSELAGESEAHPQPPRSSSPLPRRGGGPELSHDPRPQRLSSDAEQMAYDPVDGSVSLADLVEEHAVDAEELRTYLRASEGTLFSGGTVADDLARRGVVAESGDADTEAVLDYDGEDAEGPAGHEPRRLANALGNGLLAVLQSLLAVVFGAGLFIAFDQLWRWNHLVALVLTVIVVVALAAAVRILRKTEDIVSTLTAVAVGLLVTLGPLALQT
ncbi:MAG: hypothetical protein ACKOQ4_06230 [Mycobacterium sp.]